MDYVETFKGRTYSLNDRLERKVRISEEKIKKMTIQICSALKYSHTRKEPMIHSDLKPSNILLDQAQKIVLTDFTTLNIIGYHYFIKIVRDAIHNNVSLPDNSLQDSTDTLNKDMAMERTKRTQLLSRHDYLAAFKDIGKNCVNHLLHRQTTYSPSERKENPKRQLYTKNSKSVVESYDYMSPEQKAGEKATEKSNVYSLGMILYKMLTGVKVSGTWDLPSRYGCDRSWDPVIFKCLQLEPEDRYHSISELEQAILIVHEKKNLLMPAAIISVFLLVTAVGLVFTISLIDFNKDMGLFKFKDKIISFFEFTGGKKLSTIPIEFTVKPIDAQIKLSKDDEIQATANSQGSAFILELEPGEYEVEIIKEGYIKFKDKVLFNEEKNKFALHLKEENQMQAKTYTYLKDLTKPKFDFPWILPKTQITLLPIEPGSFMMGSKENDQERGKDEISLTKVFIRQPFWISDKEITQKQYDEIMWHNPSLYRGNPTLPVEKVSWTKAMEFCRKLSLKEKELGRIPEGYIYRLPTEIEWEYACRAGSSQPYYFGESNTFLTDFAWFDANSERRPHKVGGKNPNAWNIYDMLGNVWEWTLDSHGKEIPALIIANGEKNQNAEYILRGGSWRNFPQMLRCAARLKVDSPTFANSSIGFRIVLAPQVPSSK
jgi:formylglycine-generating enzyme required for sulfatase activity